MISPLINRHDSELLALLKEGDHAAFNTIYDRHWKELFNAANRMLNDREASDDIVQEIFVWLWANREKHFTDAIYPYLRAAVKYKVANLVRHGKVKDAFFTKAVASYQRNIPEEDNYAALELQKIIAAFVPTLPDKARMVFKLSREQMLSNKEIAEKLHISEKTVEAHITLSLKKLRLTLGKMSFWSILL